MAGNTRAAATLSPALRMALLASTAFATVLLATAAANAACNPNPPANGDTATCTGTTTNQGPDADIGYGSTALTNLHITVAPGASVTGTTNGIAFIEGTVINSGAISGGQFGIVVSGNVTVSNAGAISGETSIASYGGDVAVTNTGTITGGVNVIYVDAGNAIVTNSGTISGVTAIFTPNGNITATNSGEISGSFNGIYAGAGNAVVTNSGSITATSSSAIYSAQNSTVINSGSITGGQTGIGSAGITNLTNSGAIIGTTGIGVYGDSGVVATNSGSISGGTWAVTSLADITLTNSGTITGGTIAVGLGDIGIVTNSGIISGGNTGVGSDAYVTVINSGTITGQNRNGILGNLNATVTNSGTITGGRNGIASNDTATVTNSGTIMGGLSGILANGAVTVTNSATIAGGIYGIATNGTATVTTSGFIGGGSGTAILFNGNGTAASDTLNILPGARFGGRVDFGGGADRVNFGPGNWVLDTAQYDAALSTVTTPGTPYFITPNQIIVADVSSYRMMKRAIMDITGWISSVLPDNPVFDPSALSGANSFAAIDAPAPRFDDAFASFPSILPRAPTLVFTGGTVNDAHGNAFWAKGFGGRRDQGAGDGVIAGITTGAGIAIGFDRDLSGNTRLGVFAGGSDNDTRFDLNAGSIGIDTMFAGLYSRTLTGSSFLDLALIGGSLDNESKRNISGVTPQTASARYDGWFLTPLLTFGHRFALPYNLTLTPAVKVRYVAAHFDGYAESGSSVNLTVAAQDFQGAEERAEVTLAGVQHWGGSRIVFRAHAGLLARQYAGDETVNVAFIGNSVIAAIGERAAHGHYAGGGFAWQTGNVALFASGEVTGMNDNSTIVAGKGGVRVVW